ncbi:unnamed protein product [Polarella glacialis]|uniref:Serine aminopeptidase S33 domain-containing protein n=1 Tax=Polarella glacialis TaxID=89957 RepID=A0A813EDI5_POLGL|nr:unnamed protein product [Polarella glacialis]
MGCGPSAEPSPSAEPIEQTYDPLAEFKGTWFEETLIKSTTADKILVTLEGSEGVPKVKATIVGCGCGKAGENIFGEAGSAVERRRCLLLYAQSSGATHLEFTGTESKQSTTFPLPSAADGVVQHALDDIGLAGVTASLSFEAAASAIATKADMAALGLQEHVLPLSGGPGEQKAVVTYRTRPGNTKCLLWFPGRNDTFMHPHVAPMLDACGLDLYVVEHRRLGRSQIGASKADFALTSHVVDFKTFLEEQDAGIGFALEGEKKYEKVALYARSTGGIEASLYVRSGKYKDRIDALVLNSPFLDFGMGGANEMLCDAMDELMPIMSFLKGKDAAAEADMPGTSGGTPKPSSYGASIYSQYPSCDLRCRNWITNRMTAGFVAASAQLHDELQKMEATAIPTLVCYSDGDSCLDGKEVAQRAKFLSSDVTPFFLANGRHDLLLNYTKEDNQKVMDTIQGFLADKIGACA